MASPEQMLDPDTIQSMWRDFNDPEGAVVYGRKALIAIVTDTEMPFSKKLALLSAGIEPMLDGPGHDPLFVRDITDLFGRESRTLEPGLSREARLWRRVYIAHLHARALHCAGHSYEAFQLCTGILTWIESAAAATLAARRAPLESDREALLRLLRDGDPFYREVVSMALGILAASMRRAEQVRTSKTVWRCWTRDIRQLTDCFIPGAGTGSPDLYSGSPSMVQVLFLLAELRDSSDAPRIKGLIQIDRAARATDRRGQATIPLREHAIERYFGNDDTAAQQPPVAIANLAEGQMIRHLHSVDQQGFFDDEELERQELERERLQQEPPAEPADEEQGLDA